VAKRRDKGTGPVTGRGRASGVRPGPPLGPFSLLIKPAGPDCNLACDYCFYLDKSALFPGAPRHRMTEELLETLTRRYLETEQPNHAFAWQGGEPTLMGAAFFRKAVELQKRYARPGSTITNAIQTNATLITDEMAELFGREKFLVGVSLDGPAEIHDRYRVYAGPAAGGHAADAPAPDAPAARPRGSHDQVLRGIERLRKHKVEFNILVLVSQANVHRPVEVYNYLLENGLHYHQYIPCVETDSEGNLLPFAINAEQWGAFLIAVFDRWYPKDVRRVSIRHHDALMNFFLDGSFAMCSMGGRCNAYVVVEHNGNVYPCDFFVEPELRLGNVATDGWASMLRSPKRMRFAAEKARWSQSCAGCSHLSYCSGECPKMRLPGTAESRLCADGDGWQAFLDRAVPTFRSLAESAALQRGHRLPLWNPGDWDPEAPCFCGSGKKAKQCHLAVPLAGVK
jgi:uncharacterized protein